MENNQHLDKVLTKIADEDLPDDAWQRQSTNLTLNLNVKA
jgi:hypothetical protein